MKVKWFWNFDIIVATPMNEDAMIIGTGKRFPPLFKVSVIVIFSVMFGTIITSGGAYTHYLKLLVELIV